MLDHIHFYSPIGLISLFSTEHGITRIEFDDKPDLATREQVNTPLLTLCRQQIEEYFAGQRTEFSVPLDWSQLTGFRAEALRITARIPFGQLRTYGEIAAELGKPAASRAVGGAMARNPLPILIPCHRVIATSGHLTGFSTANGIASKAWLLQMEGHRVVAQKLA